MSDLFKEMQAKIGCQYLSDLPYYKRAVWYELRRMPLGEYGHGSIVGSDGLCDTMTQSLQHQNFTTQCRKVGKGSLWIFLQRRLMFWRLLSVRFPGRILQKIILEDVGKCAW